MLSNNVNISLQLINLLAEERKAHMDTNTNTNDDENENENENNNTTQEDDTDTDTDTDTTIVDDDDFRTIDISLIHAMLKQWKECLQNQIKMNIHNQIREDHRRNQNQSNHNHNHNHNRNQNHNHNHNHNQNHNQHESSVPSPLEMLQKIDNWKKKLSLFEPNIATYTIIMDVSAAAAATRGGSSDDGEVFTAENLLYRLMDESKTNSNMIPTIVTIGTVIHSLANTKTIIGAKKAENWLRYLQLQLQNQQQQTLNNEDDDDEGNNDEGNNDEKRNRNNSEQQARNFHHNNGQGGGTTRSSNNSSPNTTNNNRNRNIIMLKPNTVIYTTVIKAYADVGRVDKSEELLREMYTEYTLNNNYDVIPTIFTFNTVLGSYSKSNTNNAITKSEELIQRMKDISLSSSESKSLSNHLLLDVTPNIVSYNSLLSTIARRCSNNMYRQRQRQRQQQRKQQQKQQSDSDLDVDDSLLLLSKAEYWMEEILDNINNNNNEVVMPNQITYKVLFNIIATASTTTTTTTSSNDKKEKAKHWLSRSNNTKLINDPILLEQINTM
jgi:pentatricopeptide repeat protein